MTAWQLTFEVTRRGGDTQTLVFRKDRIGIGRLQEGNDIVLPKDNVARRHCHVEVQPDGTAIAVDTGSTNGTWLNGRKMDGPTPMRAGDKLYVGDFVVTLARAPERTG